MLRAWRGSGSTLGYPAACQLFSHKHTWAGGNKAAVEEEDKREKRRKRRTTNARLREWVTDGTWQWAPAQAGGAASNNSEPPCTQLESDFCMFRQMLGKPCGPTAKRKFGRAWRGWAAQEHGSAADGSGAAPNSGAGNSAGPRWQHHTWSWNDFVGGAAGDAEGTSSSWEGFFEAAWERRSSSSSSASGRQGSWAGQASPGGHQSSGGFGADPSSGSSMRADVQSNMQLLGLSAAIPLTSQALKDAFKKAALKHHPDRHVCSAPAERETAEGRFKQVYAAFQFLQNFVVG